MPNTPEIPEQNPEGDHVEQLLSQLSPEEIEHLATMLSGDMQDPNAAQGGEDVSSLAHAIEAHLGQNPEASVEGAAPEKMASLHLIKSASYIEGFLTHAIKGGVSVKQAVDMYDQSLAETLQNVKTAALTGKQHKLDVNKNGKIDAADLKTLRHEGKESSKHEKSESKKEEKAEHLNEIKAAAYYQGVFERAREYGLSDKQAAELIKASAAPTVQDALDTERSLVTQPTNGEPFTQGGDEAPGAGLLEKLKAALSSGAASGKEMLGSAMHQGKDALSSGLHSLGDTASHGAHSVLDYLNDPANSGALKNMGMGAAGVGALGLGAYGLNKLMHRKDNSEELQPKEAAYYEGLFKRAQEYGLSEQQTLQLIQASARNK